MAINARRRTVLLLFVSDVLMGTLSSVMFDTTMLGMAVNNVLQCGGVLIACLMGRVPRRNATYFVVGLFWNVACQTSASTVLRFLDAFAFLPAVLEGLVLPTVSILYSSLGSWSMRKMNRALVPSDVPVRSFSSMLYMVWAVSQNLTLIGLLPKKSLANSSLLWLRFGGLLASAFLGELALRTFAVQRVKHWASLKLGLKVADLEIEPEMDTVMRCNFSVNIAQCVIATLVVLLAVPGGADWPTSPLVWAALAAKLCSSLLCDVLVIASHRRWHAVAETWLQTRSRLMQPLQHWPHLQCDGGKTFQAAKTAAEAGEVARKDSWATNSGVLELVSLRWSSHWYFSDERLPLLLLFGASINFLSSGLAAVFTYCGLWYHFDDATCDGY